MVSGWTKEIRAFQSADMGEVTMVVHAAARRHDIMVA